MAKRNATQQNEIYYNAKRNEMNTTKRIHDTKVRNAIERNGI